MTEKERQDFEKWFISEFKEWFKYQINQDKILAAWSAGRLYEKQNKEEVSE